MIFTYLKGIANLGLWYKVREKFKLQSYYDVDYVEKK